MEQPGDGHFLHSLDEESALLAIMEGTATETGEAFFDALVVNLSQALKTKGALITERVARSRRLKTLASWFEGEIDHGYEYDFTGTPCESVIDGARYVHVPAGLHDLYPDSKEHREGITSYLGAPLMDVDGQILGNLAAAELQRLRAERLLRASEQKYRSIVEATNEGYVLTDDQFAILDVNNAFCQMTGFERNELLGRGLDDFCASELRLFLRSNCRDLMAGGTFEVKGTLNSRSQRPFPALIHGSVLPE